MNVQRLELSLRCWSCRPISLRHAPRPALMNSRRALRALRGQGLPDVARQPPSGGPDRPAHARRHVVGRHGLFRGSRRSPDSRLLPVPSPLPGRDSLRQGSRRKARLRHSTPSCEQVVRTQAGRRAWEARVASRRDQSALRSIRRGAGSWRCNPAGVADDRAGRRRPARLERSHAALPEPGGSDSRRTLQPRRTLNAG